MFDAVASESSLRARRDELEKERVRLNVEISGYPGPIPGCDAYFNHLLEKRALLSDEISDINRKLGTH